MKLKTLKDIEIDDGVDCKFVERWDLRQEVINHIKSGTMVEGAKFWAINFFNITEEDLKKKQ